MSIITGITSQVTLAGTPRAMVNQILALVPNPSIAPAQQGGFGYFDQMSPMCAAQMRVELTALAAAVPNV